MMTFEYDVGLMLLSGGVMLLGCFTGLILLTNILKAAPSEIGVRLTGAAVALGGGLWAMQFVGLLALRLPPPAKVNFDVRLLAFSAGVILFFSVLALALTRSQKAAGRLSIGGPMMLSGAVIAMHLIGLRALRGPFALLHAWQIEAAGAAGAAAVSAFWLWLAFRKRGLFSTVAGAAAVAIAFTAMHHFSIHEAILTPARLPAGWSAQSFSETRMAWTAAVALYLACSLGICLFMILQFRGDFHRQHADRDDAALRQTSSMAFSPGPLRPAPAATWEPARPEPARTETPPPPHYQVPARLDAAAGLPAPLRPLARGELATLVAASSAGAVFAWYDFYLYATLAPFFARSFFPPDNQTAALFAALAIYAAGFLVRPLGALIFGRLGDIFGRKHTFLVTITIMGFATFSVGLLPTFAEIGWVAPAMLMTLRLLQGLALGGEYAGAATYVGETARQHRRGYATSWLQTTATLGLLLALLAIGLCTTHLGARDFEEWGWRIPFLVSLVMLALSVLFRLRLKESRVFEKMMADGRRSKAPLSDSFLRYPNNVWVVFALLGATAGQGVVWSAGQFYPLFFLTMNLKLDFVTAYLMAGGALLVAAPFFIVFGWLSDKIGRLPIILAGCLLAAATYFPLFSALTASINPALAAFERTTPVTIHADPESCGLYGFVDPWGKPTDCDRAREFLTGLGASYRLEPAGPNDPVSLTIGEMSGGPWDPKIWDYALGVAGFPKSADPRHIDFHKAEAILFVLALYATMVYGPIAAFLVELFPTNIRYTSMSLPFHIGDGWFGGLLPLFATAMAAAAGNIYAGLWYPVIVAGMTVVIGALFLRDQRTRPIWE